jgi:hypothetical protein
MDAIQNIYKTEAYKNSQAEAIDATLEQIAAMEAENTDNTENTNEE